MKKKLEAELISIAHRILKLKNKEDVRELHQETQKLYEKLSVLLFIEENLQASQPTIGLHDMEVKLEEVVLHTPAEVTTEEIIPEPEVVIESQKETIVTTVESVVEEPVIETEEKVVELEEEKEEEIIANVSEETKEDTKEEAPIIAIPTPNKKQISFDDILNTITPEPVFDRISKPKEDEKIPAEISKIIEDKIEESKETPKVEATIAADFKEITFEKVDSKPAVNLNDKISKNSGLTLNDRMAFEKNLFDGSTEDLNRVISQIATFDNLEDAKNFLEEMVKPDYNFWKGKEEFASRFMEFVESKFV